MNKIIIAVIFMCSICFNGCAMQHVSYEIDYGKSEKYSKEDMEEAITQIMEEFDSWKGCTMHTVTYAGDDGSGSEFGDLYIRIRYRPPESRLHLLVQCPVSRFLS